METKHLAIALQADCWTEVSKLHADNGENADGAVRLGKKAQERLLDLPAQLSKGLQSRRKTIQASKAFRAGGEQDRFWLPFWSSVPNVSIKFGVWDIFVALWLIFGPFGFLWGTSRPDWGTIGAR